MGDTQTDLELAIIMQSIVQAMTALAEHQAVELGKLWEHLNLPDRAEAYAQETLQILGRLDGE